VEAQQFKCGSPTGCPADTGRAAPADRGQPTSRTSRCGRRDSSAGGALLDCQLSWPVLHDPRECSVRVSPPPPVEPPDWTDSVGLFCQCQNLVSVLPLSHPPHVRIDFASASCRRRSKMVAGLGGRNGGASSRPARQLIWTSSAVFVWSSRPCFGRNGPIQCCAGWLRFSFSPLLLLLLLLLLQGKK
jgi:hypothetical protein